MDQSAMEALCKGGCGFYGSPATDGLCSQCFKDTLKRKQDPARLSPTSAGSASAFVSSAHDARPCHLSAEVHASSKECSLASTSQSGEGGAVAPTCSSSASSGVDAIAVTQSEPSLPSTSASDATASSASSTSTGPASGEKSDAASSPTKKKTNRCHTCNKRIGLTGFECRCGGHFCGVHRYSDMHQCAFDYKKLGAMEIAKNNPVVVSEKITKI